MKENKPDEINILGDLLDLPYLSAHARKLFPCEQFRGYTEVGEIEFVKKYILAPLRAAAGQSVKITYQEGNHCERITKPRALGKEQGERLNELFKTYDTTDLGKMLDFAKFNIHWHKQSVKEYFGIYKTTHGLSLSKNASEKNIREYMSSGATGHTHRGNSHLINTLAGEFQWNETYCMRLKDEVEYLPTGKVADWHNGFVDVVFDLRGKKPYFFASGNIILNGKAKFNGKIYEHNGKVI